MSRNSSAPADRIRPLLGLGRGGRAGRLRRDRCMGGRLGRPLEELVAGVAQCLRSLGLADHMHHGTALPELAAQAGEVGVARDQPGRAGTPVEQRFDGVHRHCDVGGVLAGGVRVLQAGVKACCTRTVCHLMASVVWLPKPRRSTTRPNWAATRRANSGMSGSEFSQSTRTPTLPST